MFACASEPLEKVERTEQEDTEILPKQGVNCNVNLLRNCEYSEQVAPFTFDIANYFVHALTFCLYQLIFLQSLLASRQDTAEIGAKYGETQLFENHSVDKLNCAYLCKVNYVLLCNVIRIQM